MTGLHADAIERVLVDATDRAPDSVLDDRPEWLQLRTPSVREARRNVVFRARLARPGVRAVVDDVVAEHVARDAGMRWIVGASSSPRSLADAVAAAGVEALGPTLGMAREVPGEDLPLGVPGLTLREVRSHRDADAYGEASAVAWARGVEFGRDVAANVRRALSGPLPTRAWTAELDGEPVAVTLLRLLPSGVGYLQGAAVHPAHRGRGVYRALIHHRLAVLRRAGIRQAVVWADATGSGIVCRKLGFTTRTEAVFFESPPPRARSPRRPAP